MNYPSGIFFLPKLVEYGSLKLFLTVCNIKKFIIGHFLKLLKNPTETKWVAIFWKCSISKNLPKNFTAYSRDGESVRYAAKEICLYVYVCGDDQLFTNSFKRGNLFLKCGNNVMFDEPNTSPEWNITLVDEIHKKFIYVR